MEKRTYRVAEGVDWVNGARVPASRKVELPPAEALFDLGLGRIAPIAGQSGAGGDAAGENGSSDGDAGKGAARKK